MKESRMGGGGPLRGRLMTDFFFLFSLNSPDDGVPPGASARTTEKRNEQMAEGEMQPS